MIFLIYLDLRTYDALQKAGQDYKHIRPVVTPVISKDDANCKMLQKSRGT
jgi:hypothetical protein